MNTKQHFYDLLKDKTRLGKALRQGDNQRYTISESKSYRSIARMNTPVTMVLRPESRNFGREL